ncbi:MAG: hypothetical protein QOJ12_3552, partial [Thermoleophilales bacterium]|nr:hypothetical protein [Thermoleophilales bacterium]
SQGGPGHGCLWPLGLNALLDSDMGFLLTS